jgi:DNA-binding Lrp family transcriptional regulator
MAKAYVLINTETGKTQEVASALRATTGIVAVDVVTGPYDIVAVLQAADTNALGRLVMNYIHGTPGVKSTLTLIVVA